MTARVSLLVMLLGCSSVESGRLEVAVPDRASFPAVADAIAPSCATLDCHGQVGRNFRFYWSRGLRLDPATYPGEGETTADEYDMTYRSLCGLEPLKLDSVVRGKTKPESLTLVRKSRGTEGHKGGAPFKTGSDADRCLSSWLSGAFDPEACRRASAP